MLHRPLLRHGTNRAALNKLCLEPSLAGVFLLVADVFRPTRDPIHYELVVPTDVRDRRLVAAKIRRYVAADQRNIPRHPQAPVSQKLERGEVFRGAVEKNRRGRGVGKQGFEASLEPIVSPLPTWHIVLAHFDSVGRHFIAKKRDVARRARQGDLLVQQHNSLVSGN